MTERLYVFTYDISSPSIRRRVARQLEEVAARVQESVFEARLAHREAKRLARHVATGLQTGDSLRVYAVGAADLQLCLAFGAPPLAEAQDFHLL